MDWLTKSYECAETVWDILPQVYVPFRVAEQVRAAPYYYEAYRLNCGAVINMSQDTRQGAKLDFGGDALWELRGATGWTDELILKMTSATPLHKRTTRLDYAFNIVGAGNPRQIRRIINQGDYHGKLKPAPSINTPGQTRGETVYFGSKNSDFRARVYDKAAEMGDLWLAWTRCEVQYRAEYAQNCVIDTGNNITLAQHSRTKIKDSMGSFPLIWWERMLSGETAQITRLHRKESKFEARMAQLMAEILKKAGENKEQQAYIVNEWLPDLATAFSRT